MNQTVDQQVAPVTISGFVANDEEWAWAECDGEGPWQRLKPKDGAESLRAEVLVSLTNAQVAKIPIEAGTSYADLWPYLIRTVRNWNVRALDLSTGEYVPVPPPMEGGVESLQAAPGLVTEWLAFAVKFARFRNRDLGKESKSSDGMPSNQPDTNSEPSVPVKKSRRNQQITT